MAEELHAPRRLSKQRGLLRVFDFAPISSVIVFAMRQVTFSFVGESRGRR